MTLNSEALNSIIALIWQHFRLDLRDYARSSLQRRLRHICVINGIQSEKALEEFIIRHKNKDSLIERFSVSTTELFRDPALWKYLRNSLFRHLSKKDQICIWHSACSSGEEVLSTQILLHENDLNRKCKVYASDFNLALIDKAKKGIYPKRSFEQNNSNYLQSGGNGSLKAYLSSEDHNFYTFKAELIRPVQFEQFDLVLDYADETFDLIFCRNVMIYFNAALQERVLKKLSEGLNPGGFLILGHNESILRKSASNQLESFYPVESIYRRSKSKVLTNPN